MTVCVAENEKIPPPQTHHTHCYVNWAEKPKSPMSWGRAGGGGGGREIGYKENSVTIVEIHLRQERCHRTHVIPFASTCTPTAGVTPFLYRSTPPPPNAHPPPLPPPLQCVFRIRVSLLIYDSPAHYLQGEIQYCRTNYPVFRMC